MTSSSLGPEKDSRTLRHMGPVRIHSFLTKKLFTRSVE